MEVDLLGGALQQPGDMPLPPLWLDCLNRLDSRRLARLTRASRASVLS